MNVTLTPEAEALVRRQIEAGRFQTADEVIEEALGVLDERERMEQLRAKLQVGIDQADRGELVDWTPELREQIRQSARRRVKLGEKPDPDVCP
ncbi:MAG TPA: type II toxin-antitoxin system ParD family antitoxin [Thermomicrobiales bacterium]|jgi:antitoxin ParD1/3/4